MTTVCATICQQAITSGFVDPITKLPPRDECSLSALLCLYHHARQIAWERVPMLSPSCAPTGRTAAEVLGRPGCLCSEYPLFWNTPAELEARGGMRPDFLFLSNDRTVAAFIENKVGADDTHKGDAYGGQFGRYIKYLMQSDVEEPYMILLTSSVYLCKTPPWYATELQAAVMLQSASQSICTLIIRWEDVLRAVTSPPDDAEQALQTDERCTLARLIK